jgi:glycosyltransferase involved in cell wall biosynthesis
MKILILTTLYRPHLHGGSEKAATLLAESLAAKGHDVVVITLHPEATETTAEENGVRIYRLPLDNLYWPFGREHPASPFSKLLWHLRDIWNLRAARRVGKILDIEQPDVVHSHSIAGFSVSVLREVKRRNFRLVHTMHDYYLLCLKSSMFKGGHACKQRCTSCTLATLPRKYAAANIDAAIPVSNYLLQQHLSAGYLRHTPTQTLPNLNTSSITNQISQAIPADRPLIFGYIGRVEPHKGIELLLKACSLLQQPHWKLRIAGHASADYLRHLQQTYADPGIEWLGFTTAASFFDSIDICIVPSLWPEPQPYVVLEALEANKTLIVSDSGGLPEMAAFANLCKVFPAGDHEALALILSDALLHSKPWLQGGFYSRNIRKRFQSDHILSAHQSLYLSQKQSSPNREAVNQTTSA